MPVAASEQSHSARENDELGQIITVAGPNHASALLRIIEPRQILCQRGHRGSRVAKVVTSGPYKPTATALTSTCARGVARRDLSSFDSPATSSGMRRPRGHLLGRGFERRGLKVNQIPNTLRPTWVTTELTS